MYLLDFRVVSSAAIRYPDGRNSSKNARDESFSLIIQSDHYRVSRGLLGKAKHSWEEKRMMGEWTASRDFNLNMNVCNVNLWASWLLSDSKSAKKTFCS